MSEVKHSPLPFIVDKFPTEIRNEKEIEFVAETSFSFVYGKGKVTRKEKANAQFIVTACNSHYQLLEACKFAHEYIQRQAKFATPTMAVKYMAVERSLSEAIQKAEGAK